MKWADSSEIYPRRFSLAKPGDTVFTPRAMISIFVGVSVAIFFLLFGALCFAYLVKGKD